MLPVCWPHQYEHRQQADRSFILKYFALCPSAVPQVLCWASLCTRVCVKRQKVTTTAKGPELTANKKGLRRLGLFSPSSAIWKGFTKMRSDSSQRHTVKGQREILSCECAEALKESLQKYPWKYSKFTWTMPGEPNTALNLSLNEEDSKRFWT